MKTFIFNNIIPELYSLYINCYTAMQKFVYQK